MYNNNNHLVEYSIIDDLLSPAYPHFCCLNSSGIINAKSIHPILIVFAPDKLCKFEASLKMLFNSVLIIIKKNDKVAFFTGYRFVCIK